VRQVDIHVLRWCLETVSKPADICCAVIFDKMRTIRVAATEERCMTRTPVFDVIVVGGGIAGSALGGVLARAGLGVLVVEA
jgi:ribulose 1,5-bisphosphate synthetase/thiazole synthase